MESHTLWIIGVVLWACFLSTLSGGINAAYELRNNPNPSRKEFYDAYFQGYFGNLFVFGPLGIGLIIIWFCCDYGEYGLRFNYGPKKQKPTLEQQIQDFFAAKVEE